MLSPAGIHSNSSPGRMPYWSAIFLGTVNCSLEVTLGMILTLSRIRSLPQARNLRAAFLRALRDSGFDLNTRAVSRRSACSEARALLHALPFDRSSQARNNNPHGHPQHS